MYLFLDGLVKRPYIRPVDGLLPYLVTGDLVKRRVDLPTYLASDCGGWTQMEIATAPILHRVIRTGSA